MTQRSLHPFVLGGLLALTAGCSGGGSATPAQEAVPAPASAAPAGITLDRVIAGDQRAAESRARDRYRHPRETLEFFGLRPDMSVVEIWPAAGWYTEILAPYLRDQGRYIAAHWDPDAKPDFIRQGVRAYRDKLAARPDLYDRVEIVVLAPPQKTAMVPAGSVDMVLTFRNIHNWMASGQAEILFAAMYRALKPGGVLGVVEHRAPADKPQDPRAKSGYVRQDHAIELARQAGFVLEAEAEINANPLDARNYPGGVWTLPPTLREGDKDREKYLAIGESDRFTLRFRKPPSGEGVGEGTAPITEGAGPGTGTDLDLVPTAPVPAPAEGAATALHADETIAGVGEGAAPPSDEPLSDSGGAATAPAAK